MSVEDLKFALQRMKFAESMKDNENDTLVGTMNVYPNPEGRDAGTIDAPWGEDPGNPRPHGTGVETESKEDREKLIDRVFNGTAQYSAADKALIAQHFNHGKDGQHESHSPLLTRKTAAKHVPSAPTLTEQVRTVMGRR